jgi:PRTRC genetic system protein A
MRCGLIPNTILGAIIDHFVAALPIEAAAFILWNETTIGFEVRHPEIEDATRSRLVYPLPVPEPDCHLICDIHSHDTGPAFFSATDDADDAHSTKIAIVFGRLGQPGGPVMAL